jgi:hypothetical protein
MHALPTMEYPDKEGVTLKCTQVQEAVSCPLPGVFLAKFASYRHALRIQSEISVFTPTLGRFQCT